MHVVLSYVSGPPWSSCVNDVLPRRELAPSEELILERLSTGQRALRKIRWCPGPWGCHWDFKMCNQERYNQIWLVVWNMDVIFPYFGNLIIPHD